MNPTYHTFVHDIIGLQNLYLGLQNILLQLICGLLVVYLLSFFLDRYVYNMSDFYLTCRNLLTKSEKKATQQSALPKGLLVLAVGHDLLYFIFIYYFKAGRMCTLSALILFSFLIYIL